MTTAGGGAVLVTGAASGIGRAIAIHEGRRGVPVLVGTFADDPYDASEVAATITARGGTALVVDADVRDTASMDAVARLAVERFGGLSGVVANAGVLRRQSLDELEDAVWARIIDVDLNGVMRTVRAGATALVHSGAVVVVSSIAGGRVGWAGHTPYASAKAGLLGFVRSAALELGPRGIRINAILPGVVESPQSLDPVNSGGPDGVVQSAASIPLGRVGQPDDIARVAGFLLSGESAYMTGQSVVVDGGLTAIWPR